MSNDLRFWVSRIVLIVFIVFDLSLLAKIPMVAMAPDHPHLRLIIVLFLLSLLLSMPVTMYYYYAKSRRWESAHKSQDQIALETLNKLGKEHKSS